jgi:hypothetical protein
MITITLASLLHPAYELATNSGEEIADGAQLVDCQWWHPQFGCDSLQYVVDNVRQTMAPDVAIPAEQYHEDDGPVLWWRFPVVEPPYSGTPNDCDWPGYHTHFTPLPPAPVAPTQSPNEVP